jgi:hypothetical protein
MRQYCRSGTETQSETMNNEPNLRGLRVSAMRSNLTF